MNRPILYFVKQDHLLFVKDIVRIILKDDILTVNCVDAIGQVWDFSITKDDYNNKILINKYLDQLDMTYEIKYLVIDLFALPTISLF